MAQKIQKLPNKRFIEYFERKVRQTIRKYNLFKRKDRIAVAVSGGKDSTVCLYVLKKLGYSIEAINADSGIKDYSEINIQNLKGFCSQQSIPIHILSFKEEFGRTLKQIHSILKKKGITYHYCMLCGILKRYCINKFAREHKYDYIATGHNLDDEAQAFVMNLFRNDFRLAARQGPIPGTNNTGRFIQRVKPLYFMAEKEIRRHSKLHKFPVNYNNCPLSIGAFRKDFREMLDKFEKKYPSIKYNIIRFQETMVSRLKPTSKIRINECELCGEPASNKVCKTCKIFMEMGMDKEDKKKVQDKVKQQKEMKKKTQKKAKRIK